RSGKLDQPQHLFRLELKLPPLWQGAERRHCAQARGKPKRVPSLRRCPRIALSIWIRIAAALLLLRIWLSHALLPAPEERRARQGAGDGQDRYLPPSSRELEKHP